MSVVAPFLNCVYASATPQGVSIKKITFDHLTSNKKKMYYYIQLCLKKKKKSRIFTIWDEENQHGRVKKSLVFMWQQKRISIKYLRFSGAHSANSSLGLTTVNFMLLDRFCFFSLESSQNSHGNSCRASLCINPHFIHHIFLPTDCSFRRRNCSSRTHTKFIGKREMEGEKKAKVREVNKWGAFTIRFLSRDAT